MMTQQPLHELGCAQVTDYIIQVQQSVCQPLSIFSNNHWTLTHPLSDVLQPRQDEQRSHKKPPSSTAVEISSDKSSSSLPFRPLGCTSSKTHRNVNPQTPPSCHTFRRSMMIDQTRSSRCQTTLALLTALRLSPQRNNAPRCILLPAPQNNVRKPNHDASGLRLSVC